MSALAPPAAAVLGCRGWFSAAGGSLTTMGHTTRGSLRLTNRDLVALAFAAEHRFVTAAQLAVLLATTEAAVDARLRALAKAGLIGRERPLRGWPALHQVTRAGLQAAASDLSPPRPIDLGERHHDHALGWLMLDALEGRFGQLRSVTGERRMRSEDARREPPVTRHGVRLGGVGAGGRARLHYPDMTVLTASGHRVAFELERTSKRRARLESILAAYAADRQIDAVLYLVERPGTGRSVRRAAARLRIDELIQVRDLRSSGDGILQPPVARSARRRQVEREH